MLFFGFILLKRDFFGLFVTAFLLLRLQKMDLKKIKPIIKEYSVVSTIPKMLVKINFDKLYMYMCKAAWFYSRALISRRLLILCNAIFS